MELIKLAAAAILVKTAKKPRPSRPSRMSPDILSNTIYRRPAESNNPLLQFDRYLSPEKNYRVTYGDNLQDYMGIASSFYPDSARAHQLANKTTNSGPVPLVTGDLALATRAAGQYFGPRGSISAPRQRSIRLDPGYSWRDLLRYVGHVANIDHQAPINRGNVISTRDRAGSKDPVLRHELAHYIDLAGSHSRDPAGTSLSGSLNPMHGALSALAPILGRSVNRQMDYAYTPHELFAVGSAAKQTLYDHLSHEGMPDEAIQSIFRSPEKLRSYLLSSQLYPDNSGRYNSSLNASIDPTGAVRSALRDSRSPLMRNYVLNSLMRAI